MQIGTDVVAINDGLGVREGFKFMQSAYWDFKKGMSGKVVSTSYRGKNETLIDVQMDNGKLYFSCDPDDFQIALSTTV